MLVDDGIDTGIATGIRRRITATLKKGKSVSSIAVDTDITEEEIRKIQHSMKERKVTAINYK